MPLPPAPALTPDKRKTLTPDRRTGTEELASLPRPRSFAKIEEHFGDLLPPDLSERERERAITGIAVGIFINRLEPDALRKKIEQARDAVRQDRGPVIDDEKATRMAVLGFARQARAEAVERDPMAQLPGDDQRQYVAAAGYARHKLSWHPQQIREAAVDLIVRFDGDQVKAARAFGEMVMADRRVEAGHLRDQSATPVETERGKPAAEWQKRSGMARTDDELADPDELVRRAERERKADSQVARIDKLAAAVLGDREYAAYRLMRDNAEVIHLSRAETVLDGDARGNTAGKLIADRLGTSLRNGRNYAAGVIEKIRQAQDPASGLQWGPKPTFENGELSGTFIQQLGQFSAKTRARLDTPTAEIITAQRSEKSAQELEESRNRERMATRARAARLYAEKKARMAEKTLAPGQTSPAVAPSVQATRRQDIQLGL